MLRTFKEFSDYIFTLPAHKDIIVPRGFFSEDGLHNYQSILADNDGQIANYRIPIGKNGEDLHVKKYNDHYKVHWDYANPSVDPINHLLKDAPHHIPVAIFGSLLTLAIAYYLIKDE